MTATPYCLQIYDQGRIEMYILLLLLIIVIIIIIIIIIIICFFFKEVPSVV